MDDNVKRHSACDECRKRKLKCSGQSSGCAQCIKQHLTCHYSLQKQMGRPRKRQKVSDVAEDDRLLSGEWSEALLSHEISPTTADELAWSQTGIVDQNACTDSLHNAHSCAPQSAAPTLVEEPPYEPSGLLDNSIDDIDSDVTPQSHSPTTPSLSLFAESFPSTLDWSYFPDMAILPMSVTNATSGKTLFANVPPETTSSPPQCNHHSPPSVSTSTSPSTNSTPAAPSCTCLADIYLTLSDLSTLHSLPIRPQTVETLQAATRTAYAVLYCPVCPQKFQSSMQNVMLLGTLLNVIVDGWSRILRAPAKDVARGFDIDLANSLSTDADLDSSWTEAKEEQWKLFAHYLIRQYLFGDAPPPGIHLPGICPFLSTSTTFAFPSNKPPLIIFSNLCDAMERRQHTWHGLEHTGEFVQPCPNAQVVALGNEERSNSGTEQKAREAGHEKKEYLCLNILQSVRTVLASVDTRLNRDGAKGCARLTEMLGR